MPLSSPACEGGWRFMAKWFCGYGFVCAANAGRCSSSARIVIADNAIAVCIAASQARRHQRRAANRRHQQSPEGRLDHRDRQREYRQRAERRRA